MDIDARLEEIDDEVWRLRRLIKEATAQIKKHGARIKKLKEKRRSISMRDVSEAKRRAALIGAEYRAGTRKQPREYRDEYLANMKNGKLRDLIAGYERDLAAKQWNYSWTRSRVRRRLDELYAELDARFP